MSGTFGFNTRMHAQLLIVTAVLETGAGLMLLFVPATVIEVLFGPLTDVAPATGMARLAGAALVSLAVACWLARDAGRDRSAVAIVGALLAYNLGVMALVLAGELGPLGPLQWAATGLHGVMAAWCLRAVLNRTP